jgi:poly-gamma-glutamate synthesis protein (capsule biosynthesis protein)
LLNCGKSLLSLPASALAARAAGPGESGTVSLFLSGDVMTGRGIDQVLPKPSDPRLHERWVTDARRYLELAQSANGPFPRRVDFAYPWGDALDELDRARPDVRIINLETSITDSDDFQPDKGIHYRMHPGNVPCIKAAGIDCCVLANNHVLDWGTAGLEDTLASLHEAQVKTTGAGRTASEAEAPAVIRIGREGRVLVFAYASRSAGVPREWAATTSRPGVSYLPDMSVRTARRIGSRVKSGKQPGDIVVASIHWGSNWGYDIPREQRTFARTLIDEAGVDVVHGHSSHHPKGIEVYNGRPILYGCGDFLNDYEGIGGREQYRGDLTLMYLVTIQAASGRLVRLEMVPFRIRQFRLNRASADDARWLTTTMDRECGRFGSHVELSNDDRLTLVAGQAV